MSSRQAPRQYPRAARVNEVVRETLADELERMSDPRLDLVTLTGVEVSPDLALRRRLLLRARQPRGADRELQTPCGPRAPHLRAVLGKQVRLKFVPELRFREDPAIAQGQRIEEVIRSIHDGAIVPDEEGRA